MRNHSISVPGLTKNSISICSNSRIELAGHHLVAEGLAYLGYAERYLHATGLLDIDIVHEYALCSLGTQVYLAAVVAHGAELRGEHQVELAHVGPVPGAADRADYAAVQDYLLVLCKVVSLLRSHIAIVNFLIVRLFAEHVGVGLAELLLVEAVAELAAALLHLLVDLFLYFGEIVLYQHVGAVPLLGILVVYEGIVEGGDMAGRHPGFGLHEYCGVYTDNILVEARHGVPPVLLDIVLELHAQLAVVIDGRKSVIDFA